MNRSRPMPLVALLLGLAIILILPSCATVPQSRAERKELVDDAQERLAEMKDRSPAIAPAIKEAAGYAVFPNVGKGGFLIGGAFGRGAVYGKGGEFLGYAKVTQASIGGVVGGRVSSLLLIFQNESDLTRFTTGDDLVFGAEATAIAIDAGVSDAPQFTNGVAVYILPRNGMMADASLSGQQFAFETRRESSDDRSTTQSVRTDDGDAIAP